MLVRNIVSEFSEGFNKVDLLDFTFLMPLRIDSDLRKANVETSIKYILKYFKTTFIVLEADTIQNYYSNINDTSFRYIFVKDNSKYYNKNKSINRLIELSETPYLAVWDADAIISIEQILISVRELRSGLTVLSIPYDGRVFNCDKSLSELFREIPDINLLLKLAPSLPLMYGYHSTGGAFMVNKEKYLKTGNENENFHGWGPEDMERIKKLEILNVSIHSSTGPFFHLWHPRGKNSWYGNTKAEIHNRREFLKTCSQDISY